MQHFYIEFVDSMGQVDQWDYIARDETEALKMFKIAHPSCKVLTIENWMVK